MKNKLGEAISKVKLCNSNIFLTLEFEIALFRFIKY